MKPKRPSEADLLALVQNGFNAQLPKDRAAQAPPAETPPTLEAKGAPDTEAAPAPLVPMARITIIIPEELRYRLKLHLMNQRWHGRGKLTQDEYCATAIADLLDLDEDRGPNPWHHCSLLKRFIQSCLEGGGLSKVWESKVRLLLEDSKEIPRSRHRPPFSGRGHTYPVPQSVPPRS